MEDFYTLQGEGFNTGKAACFLRIGGCDVGCNWCDVKESWNVSDFPLTPVEEIIQKTLIFPARAVVITGGEPLLYNMDPLCRGLKEHGIQTYLETSGSCPVTGSWNWICVSPKKEAPPLDDLLAKADELKVIISDLHDFQWAESNKQGVRESCYLFLQPEWSRRNEVTPLIVKYILTHPEWRISIQSHKYMGIP
ncbi:MAG: 7-carboxy-7-deazaguanine synthase QueE [Bacteroidota bacterium]|nr:7-carboxy-7-deazaguanine synthase QueE [Bacteroidota bacterium]